MSLSVGAPCVRVADVGGEEFQEARPCALANSNNEGRGSGVGDGDKLIHDRPRVRQCYSSLEVTMSKKPDFAAFPSPGFTNDTTTLSGRL